MCAVGRALLPVESTDGQECPSYAGALASDPNIVVALTVNHSNGITPRAPDKQFADLDRPTGFWIGGDDEIFEPDKVIAFGKLSAKVLDDSVSIHSHAEVSIPEESAADVREAGAVPKDDEIALLEDDENWGLDDFEAEAGPTGTPSQ